MSAAGRGGVSAAALEPGVETGMEEMGKEVRRGQGEEGERKERRGKQTKKRTGEV
jgi:hypothetical protein